MEYAPIVEVVVTPAAESRPVKLRMLVDTGNTGTLVIFSRTVKGHQWESFVDGFKEANAIGVSGTIRSQAGQLFLAELGSVKLPDAVTHVSEDLFSETDIDGLIGSEIFKNCRVTFDLSRRMMYLQKVVEFG